MAGFDGAGMHGPDRDLVHAFARDRDEGIVVRLRASTRAASKLLRKGYVPFGQAPCRSQRR